jgi:hypothetical protein
VCNSEAPSVEEVAKETAGQVDIVGVAWNGDDASYQEFVDKHGLTFTQALDPGDGSLFAHFSVPSQPAWVLLDAAGNARTMGGAVEKGQLLGMLGGLASS